MSRLAAWLIAVGLTMTAAGVAHAQAVQRFDYLVREDMFRGFAGDTAALERAMALCEARLAENSNNAETLVWHGTGLLFRAGEPSAPGTTTRASRSIAPASPRWPKPLRSARTTSAF
jgi:hypothetical protein